MNTGVACNRTVVCIDASESIQDAANLMRVQHVGDLVITRWDDSARIPTGIITDRDLVLEVMAPGLDSDAVCVGDLFAGPDLVLAHVEDELEATIDKMRTHGVRRIPVVSTAGHLVGLITMDDILGIITEQLTDMVTLIERQTELEARRRSSRTA